MRFPEWQKYWYVISEPIGWLLKLIKHYKFLIEILKNGFGIFWCIFLIPYNSSLIGKIKISTFSM
jgi:hypothetical protein